MGLDRVDTINVVDGAITGAKIDNTTITASNMADLSVCGDIVCCGGICTFHISQSPSSNSCDILLGTGDFDTCQGNIIAQGSGGVGGCINAGCCIYVAGDLYSGGTISSNYFVLPSSPTSCNGSLFYIDCCLVMYLDGMCYCFNPM